MTYLFDRDRAIKTLAEIEPTWGGDIRTRMAAQEAAYRSAHQVTAEAHGTRTDGTAASDSAAVERAAAASDAAAEAAASHAPESGSVEDDR
jgi:penicillin-binding protein 2